MAKAPAEPKRQMSLDNLRPEFAAKVRLLLAAMRARQYDPVVFESIRTVERQAWLWGVGRTHSLKRKPVSWWAPPFSKAPHVRGRGVDIISKSTHWGNPKFFLALKQEARKLRLRTISKEGCHVEWRG